MKERRHVQGEKVGLALFHTPEEDRKRTRKEEDIQHSGGGKKEKHVGCPAAVPCGGMRKPISNP